MNKKSKKGKYKLKKKGTLNSHKKDELKESSKYPLIEN
jgi:hypothetical protein